MQDRKEKELYDRIDCMFNEIELTLGGLNLYSLSPCIIEHHIKDVIEFAERAMLYCKELQRR